MFGYQLIHDLTCRVELCTSPFKCHLILFLVRKCFKKLWHFPLTYDILFSKNWSFLLCFLLRLVAIFFVSMQTLYHRNLVLKNAIQSSSKSISLCMWSQPKSRPRLCSAILNLEKASTNPSVSWTHRQGRRCNQYNQRRSQQEVEQLVTAVHNNLGKDGKEDKEKQASSKARDNKHLMLWGNQFEVNCFSSKY